MYDANYKVTERNIALAVVFSFITFGIYSLYWLYKLQADTNRLLGLRNETSPGVVVLLTIVTCGLYQVYWAWCQGNKFRAEAEGRGSSEADHCPLMFLILQAFSYTVGVTTVINKALMQDRINQLLRMQGMGNRYYDPNRFNHTPEEDIARRYESRAAEYEAKVAEDADVLAGIEASEGKRSLYLTDDADDGFTSEVPKDRAERLP